MEENGEEEPTWPEIDPEFRAWCEILFYSQGPVNGYLLGERIRELFLLSKLPLQVLSQIWNLADVSNDNLLHVHEFVLVMHLIHGVKQGLRLPGALPPHLLPAQTLGTDLPPLSGPEDKAFARVFEAASSQGSLEPGRARLLLLRSKLTPEQLSKVWDSADIDRDGKLSADEWKIACQLVRLMKKGEGSVEGPVNVFSCLPHRLAPRSLQARKRKLAEHEAHKQKYMNLKEQRKRETLRENRRLEIWKEKLQLLQELFELLKKAGATTCSDEEFKSKVDSEKERIERHEEIVFRLKKEHEKVRQETVKIILGEQKLTEKAKEVKEECDELNKRISANLSKATKEADPFHQLFELRRERRRSAIVDTEDIVVHHTLTFDPFDPDRSKGFLSGKTVFQDSPGPPDNNSLPPELTALLPDLEEFSDQFVEKLGGMDASQLPEEDPIFKPALGEMSEEVTWLGLSWTGDKLAALADCHLRDLQIKLDDLKEELQKLNKEGPQLLFKNPEDYLARQRAKEEEERQEKSRYSRRSGVGGDRRGLAGSPQLRARLGAAHRQASLVDQGQSATRQAAREFRLKRRSLNLDSTSVATSNSEASTAPGQIAGTATPPELRGSPGHRARIRRPRSAADLLEGSPAESLDDPGAAPRGGSGAREQQKTTQSAAVAASVNGAGDRPARSKKSAAPPPPPSQKPLTKREEVSEQGEVPRKSEESLPAKKRDEPRVEEVVEKVTVTTEESQVRVRTTEKKLATSNEKEEKRNSSAEKPQRPSSPPKPLSPRESSGKNSCKKSKPAPEPTPPQPQPSSDRNAQRPPRPSLSLKKPESAKDSLPSPQTSDPTTPGSADPEKYPTSPDGLSPRRSAKKKRAPPPPQDARSPPVTPVSSVPVASNAAVTLTSTHTTKTVVETVSTVSSSTENTVNLTVSSAEKEAPAEKKRSPVPRLEGIGDLQFERSIEVTQGKDTTKSPVRPPRLKKRRESTESQSDSQSSPRTPTDSPRDAPISPLPTTPVISSQASNLQLSFNRDSKPADVVVEQTTGPVPPKRQRSRSKDLKIELDEVTVSADTKAKKSEPDVLRDAEGEPLYAVVTKPKKKTEEKAAKEEPETKIVEKVVESGIIIPETTAVVAQVAVDKKPAKLQTKDLVVEEVALPSVSSTLESNAATLEVEVKSAEGGGRAKIQRTDRRSTDLSSGYDSDGDPVPPPLPDSTPPPLPSGGPPALRPSTLSEMEIVEVEYSVPVSATPVHASSTANNGSALLVDFDSPSEIDHDLPSEDAGNGSKKTLSELRANFFGLTKSPPTSPTADANLDQYLQELKSASDAKKDGEEADAMCYDSDVSVENAETTEVIFSPGDSGILVSSLPTSPGSDQTDSVQLVSCKPLSSSSSQPRSSAPPLSKASASSSYSSVTPRSDNSVSGYDSESPLGGTFTSTTSSLDFDLTASGTFRSQSSDGGLREDTATSPQSGSEVTSPQGILSPRGGKVHDPQELVDRARQFADMVQRPNFTVRKEKGGEEMSEEALQELEMQRRAVISQATVRKRASTLEGPFEGRDQQPEPPAVEEEIEVTAATTQEATSVTPKSSPDPPVTYTPSTPRQDSDDGRPAKVNLYSQNVVQENDTTENVDRESIANLGSTRKQWEDILSTAQKQQEDTTTPRGSKKTTVRHWEVKIPTKSRTPLPDTVSSSNSTSLEVTSPEPPTMSDSGGRAGESAIEREIRLANEREELLRREQEARLAQEKAVGKVTTTAFEDSSSQQGEETRASFHELTEADRGSEMWQRERLIKQELEEQQRKEEEVRKRSVGHSHQDQQNEEDGSGNEASTTESVIEREIRQQREREKELERQRQPHSQTTPRPDSLPAPPVHTPTPTPSPARPPVQSDINHNEAKSMSGDSTPNFQHEGESIIARELRELREREEELRRLRGGRAYMESPKEEARAASTPSSHPSTPANHHAASTPSSHPATWQKDVSPYLMPAKRSGSIDSLSSGHSTGRTPSDATPSREIKVTPFQDSSPTEEAASPAPAITETPIAREIRLARERENELRRAKGMPELPPVTQAQGSHDSQGQASSAGGGPVRYRVNEPSSSSTMKKLASGRLQQEILAQKQRELDLRKEGKIITTSEEHIEPLKYADIIGDDRSGAPAKRNFTTRKTPAYAPPSDLRVEIDEVDAKPAKTTPSPGDATLQRRKVSGAAALFSYKESKQSAESKIERELREMREREEELRMRRAHDGAVTNGEGASRD